MKTLLKMVTGSNLYGTNGPNSDIDHKVIYLPDINDLLLNRKQVNSKQRPVSAQEKMLAGEIETEFVPLQVFTKDFLDGQTYALEAAFAVANPNNKFGILELDTRFEFYVNTLVKTFLTSNITKMKGYAAKQAQLYGVKGERLNVIEDLLAHMKATYIFAEICFDDRIDQLVDWVVARRSDMIFLTTVKGTKSGYDDQPAFSINNRTYALTTTIAHFYDAMLKLKAKYGERAKAAQGDEVDWKALSHAVRVAGQAKELLETKLLSFPRPDAAYLKAVKNGELPFEEVRTHFEALNSEVDELFKKTTLPEKNNQMVEALEELEILFLRNMYELD